MAALNLSLVLLRLATQDDREFLWWLHRETMRDYVDKTWGWDDNWQREQFDEEFDSARLQIIEYRGRPIGSISVDYSGDEIFLASIEVAPEFQNKGVATHLIENLLSDSDRLNLPVKLDVLKVNPARRLYERLGFECVSETQTHYVMTRKPNNVQKEPRSRSTPLPPRE